jgi:oligosaccharide repeat unit polymerase
MLTNSGRRSQTVWTNVMSVNLFILVLLMLSALVYSILVSRVPEELLIFLLSVVLLVVFIWSLWSWYISTNTLFDPYVLFLIAATLFNGGHAFLRIFHLDEPGGILEGGFVSVVHGGFPPETALQGLFLVILGLVAFHTGGLLSVPEYRKAPLKEKTRVEGTLPTAYALRLIGWGLLAISLLPACLILKDSIALASTSGYVGTLTQVPTYGIDAAPEKLADFIVPASIFLLAGSKGHRFNITLSTLIVLGYSLPFLFVVGQRNQAVMLLCAYAWVYHRTIRPLPKTLLLSTGSVLLFIVFPMVRVFRDVVLGESRFSPTAFLDAYLSIENPIISLLAETGNSMQAVVYTVGLVPDNREFDMGASYLYSLSTIVPNLFWEVHPARAHGTLSEWLFQTVAPQMAGVGGYFGFGFSFIAEAYLNFGWYGAPLALGIMGFLLGRLVLWADRSNDPAKFAMVGAFTAFFLIFARGESHEVVRYIVWYSLIPYAGACVLRSLLQPKSHEEDKIGLQIRERFLGSHFSPRRGTER